MGLFVVIGEKRLNIQELRKIGKDKLNSNKIDDANIKTDILLQYVFGLNKTELIINCNEEVEEEKKNIFLKFIEEIIEGNPVQYITHEQEFMNLKFYVDENVLIPQPDTEILVEEVLKCISEIKDKEKIEILDMCTGSGAIAISIKKHTEHLNKNIDVYALDISEKALEIAKKNAINNNVNINFILSDMFSKLKQKDFDIIVSNPPYIETEIIIGLSKEVQNEPHLALDGGKDGLDFYRVIAKEGYTYLNEKGCILLEIGYNQKEKVMELFEKNKKYDKGECIQDLSGNNRVLKFPTL